MLGLHLRYALSFLIWRLGLFQRLLLNINIRMPVNQGPPIGIQQYSAHAIVCMEMVI